MRRGSAEICELQLFLNKMGAKIKGAGTSTITIEGVTKLKGIEHTTMPDRIVAGTMLIGAAMCGGSIAVHNCRSKHLQALISKLQQSSCKIAVYNDKIELESRGRLFSIENIETQPYPGFPTDLQAPIMAMQAVSYGTSIITENIFETRFKHARTHKDGSKDSGQRQKRLRKGSAVSHRRKRDSGGFERRASLVLAGLRAEGVTTVHNINHIDRGHEALEEQLSNLGADIVRERQ